MRIAFIIFIFLSVGIYLDISAQDCPTGDVVFNSQEDIDVYATTFPNCTTINGDLMILGSNSSDPIVNLFSLNNISTVNGLFRIENNNSLTSLSGLEQITSVSGEIIIEDNSNLNQCLIELFCQDISSNQISILGNDVGCRDIDEVVSFCIDPSCPDEIPGYSLLGEFEDHTYFISEVRSTWTSAQQAVEQLAMGNAYLTSIGSFEENDFIRTRIGFEDEFFIGLQDFDTEGDLAWDSGEPLGYTNYDSLEFVNNNNNDFGAMYFPTGEWLLLNGLATRFHILELGCDALIPDLTLANLIPDTTVTGSRQIMPYSVDEALTILEKTKKYKLASLFLLI